MKIVESIIKSLFRFGLDKVLDMTRVQYHEKKAQQIIGSLKSAGQNIVLPAQNRFLNPKYITIGDNFFSLYNLRLEAIDIYYDQKFSPEIIIGNNVVFNTDVHIGCIDKVCIGNDVLIASKVYISDHSHGEINLKALEKTPATRSLISKGRIVIGDKVWIGEGVCILPGVTIGGNSIIGANSVVTKSIPSNSVAAGVPAKIMKYLQ